MAQINDCGERAASHYPDLAYWTFNWRKGGGASRMIEISKREQFYQQQGIHSVPAIIINDRHLISGGQPVEVFVQALRQIAAQG